MKKNILIILALIIIVILVIFLAMGFRKENTNNVNDTKQITAYEEELVGFSDVPQKFETKDAIERGYFVIDGRKGEDKIYNKNVLDRFIENTDINSKDRKADKIRIANYNYDGYPTIYELEYREFANENQEETKEAGYVLTVDESRNNLIPKSIVVNDDIPGSVYGITIEEDPEINAAIIKLSLYAIIDNIEDTEHYKEIEVTRFY